MSNKGILNKVKEIVTPVIEDLNFDLVDVEYVKEHSNYYLRIYIDKIGGITLDDCQKTSLLVSEKLDKDDPIDKAYFLEVSSPGLDRPLKTDKDLNRNIGRDIEVNLYVPLDGTKSYEGELKGFDDECLKISNQAGELITIQREKISLVKLALKF